MDKARMLAEIKAYLEQYPLIEENDITVGDLRDQRPGMSGRGTLELMHSLAASGKWKMVKVVRQVGSRKWLWVLRK